MPSGSNFIFILGIRAIGIPLAFIANLLIARLMGPAEYGIYLTLLSAGLLAGGFANFGTSTVLVREIAKQTHEKQRDTFRNVTHWTLRFTIITGLISTLLLLTWMLLEIGTPKSDYFSRILTGLLIPVSLGSTLITGLLLGLGSVARSQALVNVIKNGVLLVSVLILYALSLPYNVSSLLAIQVIAFAVAIIVGIAWLYRLIGHLPKCATVKSIAVDQNVKRSWRRSAKHFFAGSVAVILINKLDVLLVNALGGETAAGLFGVAMRLGQFAGVGGLVLMSFLRPRFALAVAEQQTLRITQLTRYGMLLSCAMAITSLLVGWLAAPWIMQMLGTGFYKAILPFRWILLAYFVWSLAVPGYAFLSMSGNEASLALISWMQLLISVVLTVILVPHLGALGGAWAFAAGMIIASVAVLILLFFRLREIAPSDAAC
ncbi:MAG: oligosaccharide flippase family protein [Anaerolineaceae bacterium]|nr:oligosaccharide flippase family protein [Anaerolineaceae bacterium]